MLKHIEFPVGFSRDSDSMSLPHLHRSASCTQLIVDSAPFISLAGEVHNSSASSLEYMAGVWDRLCALNCNSAIVPVYSRQAHHYSAEFLEVREISAGKVGSWSSRVQHGEE